MEDTINNTPPVTAEVPSPASVKLALSRADFIRTGEYIKKAVKQANIGDVKTQAIRFRNWLIIARMCREHRNMAKKVGIIWATWLKENIPAYSRRTVADYIRLSKVPNIEKYMMLGKGILMYLITKIDEDSKSNDPLGDILEDYDIHFNPEDATPEDEFKTNLDVAIQMRNLENADITGVDESLLRKLIAKGSPLNLRNIRQLKLVVETGGDVNKYLTGVYENDNSETLPYSNPLSYRHINDLATRIDVMISEHKENAKFIKEVDKAIILKLSIKINDLMKVLYPENSAE